MKRGQVAVITTVVLLVVALVAVSIFWLTARGLLEKQTSQLSTDCITINLQISRAVTGENNITIRRDAGEGALENINVLVNDKTVNNTSGKLNILESKVVFFNLGLVALAQGQKVQIAPVIKSASGENLPCGIVDTFIVQ